MDPKFNIHETYKKVRILNPYRNSVAPSGGVMPRAENLIRFYKFNETTGDAIDETGTQNGVVIGSMVRDGVKYTGNGTDSYLDVGLTSETTAYTLAFRITTGNDVYGLQFIAAKFIGGNDRPIYFYIYRNDFISKPEGIQSFTYPITPNTTYEVVLTLLSSGQERFYVNKILERTSNVTFTPLPNDNLRLFNRNLYATSGTFSIDYFAMWDAELNEIEVQAIPEGSI